MLSNAEHSQGTRKWSLLCPPCLVLGKPAFPSFPVRSSLLETRAPSSERRDQVPSDMPGKPGQHFAPSHSGRSPAGASLLALEPFAPSSRLRV